MSVLSILKVESYSYCIQEGISISIEYAEESG